MRIVAVVLNWKRPEETIACVASVRATAPNVEVIVVDNASGDGSAERIGDAHPDATLIRNDENLGYAGGNNVGIRPALDRGAEAVMVLNNDVLVQAGCIQALEDALAHDPGLGIAAPVSLLRDDPSVVDFYRADVDAAHVALHAHGRDTRDVPTQDAPTDYATGSAMLLRATVLHRIGLFDERFFLVWEDVDLCLRARRAGHAAIRVIARAHVLHGRSVSFGGDASPSFQYFYVRNSFLFAGKHTPWWRKKRTRALLERRYRGWLDKPETTPAMREAIARGLADGLAGRFGPAPDALRG